VRSGSARTAGGRLFDVGVICPTGKISSIYLELASRGLLRASKTHFHVKYNLLKRFNLIWAVQSPAAKIFCFPSTGDRWLAPRHPVLTRGAYASSRTLGAGCNGRGSDARRAALFSAFADASADWPPTRARPVEAFGVDGRGRRSRVVLTPRCWRQVGGGNSIGDGGKRARSPGRARRKPLKPLRREGRVRPVNPW
jgi:hypothetical protein